MANIISVIGNNIIPGPKRDSTGSLYIFKIDDNPELTGCKAAAGSLSLYGGRMFLKEGASDFDWKEVKSSERQLEDLLRFSKGSIEVDASNSTGGYISAAGIFNTSEVLEVFIPNPILEYSDALGTHYLSNTVSFLSDDLRIRTGAEFKIGPKSNPKFSCTVNLSTTIGFMGFSALSPAEYLLTPPESGYMIAFIANFDLSDDSSDDSLVFIAGEASDFTGIESADFSYNFTEEEGFTPGAEDIYNFQISIRDGTSALAEIYKVGTLSGGFLNSRELVISKLFEGLPITPSTELIRIGISTLSDGSFHGMSLVTEMP